MKRLQPEQQKCVLGAGKFDLYQDGKISQGMIRTPLAKVAQRVTAIDDRRARSGTIAPMQAIEQARRAAWSDFPDVLIMAEERDIKRHPEYAAAKAGDVGAAKRMVAQFVSVEVLAGLTQLLAGHRPRLLPVHAQEAGGVNRIPSAMAELLAERLNLSLEDGVVQANTAGHTSASGWTRLARPAVFDGNVQRGVDYLLVDDFIDQGEQLQQAA